MALGDKLKNRMSGIGRWVMFSIREKHLIYIAVAAMVAVGAWGLLKMNKDEFPTFQIKQGLVAGIYPGATAAEVEEQLTKPLEETLMSYKEVDREHLVSISRDGICYLYVDLNVHQSKKDEVWSKIKLGLQTRKMTLPAGVLAVAVLDDFSSTSAMLIAVESDDKSYTELQQYGREMCEELRRLPTLAKATIVGEQTEEIAVTLDREKLSRYGINPTSILLSYQTSSMPVGAGTFSTDYTSSPIHIAPAVSSEYEISNHILYSDPVGNIIRLKDVATIERRLRESDNFVSYNGHSAIIVNIEMRPGNDIVAFGEDVQKIVSKYSETLPDSVRMSTVTNQPKVVDKSVWSFLRDLVISMLVVIFVMLMLFPMRSALIASSGVPVCTAVAIAAMYMTGMELNTVTLAALIVVLGMIVDDSIITMDGYMDKMSRGLVGDKAAAASANELFMPTFIATLAICLMFFPIKVIITGYLGDFVELFPWVILISLMTSLFYAVTVVPSLEVKYITPADPSVRKNFIGRAQDAFFEAIQRLYDKFQDVCFRHPVVTIGAGIAAVTLGVVMFLQLNIQMMPKAARSQFVVELYSDPGDGISQTKAYADSLTERLLADSRVESVTAFVGTGAPRFSATYTPILPSPQTAQLIVNTTTKNATDELLKEYQNNFEHLYPGVQIHYKQMDYQVVDAPIMVRFEGEDRYALMEAATKLKAYLSTRGDVVHWVHTDVDDFVPSIKVTLDSDEAGRLDINKALVSLSLSGTFNGQTVTKLWEGANSVPVNLYSEGISKTMPYEEVANQLLPTAVPGVFVPLRQVASVQPDWNLRSLRRVGGENSVTVYADLKFGESSPAMEKDVKKFIAEEIEPELAPGVSIRYSGLSATNSQVIPEIGLSFLAAVTILFLFLLIHFHKTSIAVLTMVLSLLCLFGASFGLWIFRLDFSITAVLGLISLVGIIVRNGIIMFEYAEELRFKNGVPVLEAAMEAGKRRMRPIFLTSCTTALGVLPMVISGDQLWMPMGVVICFGTLLSIGLIVFIMPVSYWVLFKNDSNEKD